MFKLKENKLLYFDLINNKKIGAFKGCIIMTGLMTRKKKDFELTHKLGFEIFHKDNIYKSHTLYANNLEEYKK